MIIGSGRRSRWEPVSRRARSVAPIAAAVWIGLAVLLGTQAAAQEADPIEPEAPLPFGTLGLELIDHSVDVTANGDLIVTYRIVGGLADAELLFIDQDEPAPATTTTTTATTTTTEDTPSTTTVGGDAPTTTVPAAPPPATTAPPATTLPEPEVDDAEDEPPVPLSVDVVLDDRVDEVDDLIGRLGPTATPSVFQSPADGIRLDDVRPSITVDENGDAEMRLVIGTDTAPSQADRLGLDEPGLYPLLVSLLVDGNVVARHGTILHRVDARPTVATVGLSAIGAVSQPETLDAELGPLVAAAARLTEYAALGDHPIWMSIPPPVMSELTDGASARDLVIDSLRDDTMQGLPATPFDISSAVAVERDDAFVRELTIGEAQLQAALPGVPVRRDIWYVDRPLSSEAAALLRSLGVRALAMTPEVARTTIAPLPDELVVDRSLIVELPDGSPMTVLLVDAAEDRFGVDATESALAAGTETEWALQYLAELYLSAFDDEPLEARGRLLAGDDLGPLDATLLNELVRLDAATVIHDVVDAGALATRVSPQPLDEPGTLPAVAGPSLAGRLDAIEATGLVLANASSMLADDDERAAEWSRSLDSLVSTALTDEQADAVLRSVTDEAAELTGSVVAPEPFSITLTSRTGTIPLTIGNTSEEELRVRLQLSSPRLLFPEGDPEVVLAPGTNEIEIPVEARTNGTTSLEVMVVTPLGGPLTDTVRVSTRVQALSGLAQLVTATLLLLLLTWWLNHWRARRDERLGPRPRRATTPAAAAIEPDASVAEPETSIDTAEPETSTDTTGPDTPVTEPETSTDEPPDGVDNVER